MGKQKVIEQGLNDEDSTIKEMTDFFEPRVQNLDPKEDKKKSAIAAKNFCKKSRKGDGKTPTPVSYNLAKNPLKLAVQARSTVIYTGNTVILQIVVKI